MGGKTVYEQYEDSLEIAKDTGNTELVYALLAQAECNRALTDEEYLNLESEYYPN